MEIVKQDIKNYLIPFLIGMFIFFLGETYKDIPKERVESVYIELGADRDRTT